MALLNEHKLQNLLKQWPLGSVASALWLESMGISKQLRLSYQKGGWLVHLAHGAFVRPGDKVEWPGGVYAIQQQLLLGIYPGGLTALSLKGLAHYIRLSGETLYLFARPRTVLPRWFKDHNWGRPVVFVRSGFLPERIGLTMKEEKTFSIEMSGAERAILECLYLAPKFVDLVECYQIMEGLVNLRPRLLQELLEKCTSIKVKRLFLYMADKANHLWLQHLDKTKFNLGSGDRSIVKNGVYASSYGIMIPKELADL